MKRIIILYTANLCQRVEDLFSLSLWVESGYTVEYWDLADITFQEKLAPISVDGVIEKKISSKKEFAFNVKMNANNSTFLMWFGYCTRTAFVFRSLSKANARFAIICNGLLPSVQPQKKKRINDVFISFRERFYSLLMRTSLFTPATYSFVTASTGRAKYKVNKTTVHSKCNSGDYEALVKNKKTDIKESYFLFLDQYIPYHNDNRIIGRMPIEAGQYFKSLNEFFDKIEKQYGIPVIIAAHPSAKRYETMNPFDGRKFIFNKTMELAADSKAIITHFTTAISSAVVYNKPAILLSSDELISLRPDQYVYMKALHEELGAPIVNMDHLNEMSILLPEIDEFKYKAYKYKYLSNPETENHNNFENISKVIELC